MAYRRSPLMQERLADNRQRILQVTRRLIAEDGFRGASVAAVASEVGLSTGAIYNYFPSKAALFVEVLTEAVSHEVKILRKIIAKSGSAEDHLRAAVESFASRALEGPHLAYAFIAEPVDPEVEAARIIYRQRFGKVFEDILKAGIESGEFPPQDVEIGAACIVGAFTEALVRPIGGQQGATKPAKQKKLVKAISAFCVRAASGHLEAG